VYKRQVLTSGICHDASLHCLAGLVFDIFEMHPVIEMEAASLAT